MGFSGGHFTGRGTTYVRSTTTTSATTLPLPSSSSTSYCTYYYDYDSIIIIIIVTTVEDSSTACHYTYVRMNYSILVYHILIITINYYNNDITAVNCRLSISN
jgi:hypothetical protein